MPKLAWAKNICNAYNNVKKGENVYAKDGTFLGKANGVYARCTAKSPGSVQLGDPQKHWISGDVEKKNNNWYITDNCSVS